MPLFSSKHKQDKATSDNPSRLHKSGHGNTDMYTGDAMDNTTAGTGTNTFNPLPTSGAGGGGGIGYNQGPVGAGAPGITGAHDPYTAGAGGGLASQGYAGHGGGITGPGATHHGGTGPGQNQWFGSGQEFSSTNATYGSGGGPAIPPSNVVNHGPTTGTGPTHGTTERLTGKVESAMGTLLGSSALKAKGLQKEQEFNSVKLQSSELAEAEKLEREAMMRRERAVAHGAHPANANLGAGHLDRNANQGGF